MAILLKGAPVAEELINKIKKDVDALKADGIIPTLAVLRVGEKENDIAYENSIIKCAKKADVKTESIVVDEGIPQDEFEEKLFELNNDKNIHGILVFRPLPSHLDDDAVRLNIAPSKDVDGCTDISLAGVFTGADAGFPPCTAEAVMKILEYYDIEIEGKRAAIIGRSLVIGRPVAMMLMEKGATPVICHSKTKDVSSITKEADIVVAALGRPETIDKTYLDEKQTVIDVGMSWNDEKQKLTGDVKFDEAEDLVRAITPVPGGVGSVTTSILISHVVEAAKKISEF